MSSTPAVGAAAGAAVAASHSALPIPANMQISESQFLQLISTQLKNQNPLSPADPTQFLSQLEGMSEVSSLQNVQTSIDNLTSSMQASQVLSGTALLGHQVLSGGSTANLAAGGTVSGAVTAPAGASSLTVAVTNASGALVSAFNVAPQGSGLTPFSWNGTTASGAAAPAGPYTISVNATVGSSTQALNPLLQSTVQSVTFDGSTNSLNLNTTNGTVPLSAVVSVQ